MDQSLGWRVLVDPPLAGSRNMARDHALARELGSGQAVLRLYRWDRPTISLGRNEPGASSYDSDMAREAGIPFVRRPTGGRAVLHDAELTYAVVVPLSVLGDFKRAYRLVNEGLVSGLRGLGADVSLAGANGESRRPSAGPCFRAPAAGEVIAGGRKLVGSAQARIGGALLQHGSLIVSGDQGALERLRRDDEPVEPPATLEELLERPPAWEELTRAVRAGLETAFGGDWSDGELNGRESAAERELEALYASDDWTWRV